MKDNFQDKIYVRISYDINLKNWEEYDDIAQSFVESGIYESNNRRVLGNILDLQSEMDKINLEYLSSIIYDSLSISFNKNFDTKYIDLQKISDNNDSLIVLNINCKIKNQEIRDSYLVYPNIWFHTKKDLNTHTEVFQNYLLGINIDYYMSIKIPNSDDNFIETMHSKPSDYLKYHSPNVSPYAIMVKSTFENYSMKITNLFGL